MIISGLLNRLIFGENERKYKIATGVTDYREEGHPLSKYAGQQICDLRAGKEFGSYTQRLGNIKFIKAWFVGSFLMLVYLFIVLSHELLDRMGFGDGHLSLAFLPWSSYLWIFLALELPGITALVTTIANIPKIREIYQQRVEAIYAENDRDYQQARKLEERYDDWLILLSANDIKVNSDETPVLTGKAVSVRYQPASEDSLVGWDISITLTSDGSNAVMVEIPSRERINRWLQSKFNSFVHRVTEGKSTHVARALRRMQPAEEINEIWDPADNLLETAGRIEVTTDTPRDSRPAVFFTGTRESTGVFFPYSLQLEGEEEIVFVPLRAIKNFEITLSPQHCLPASA